MKQTNIFNKLKANLKVLLLVCFALVAYSGSSYANPPAQNPTEKRLTVTQNKVPVVQPGTPVEKGCNKARMDSIYKSGCYACDVVTVFIGSFINACTYLYEISRQAGEQLLGLGCMLWIAFYILAKLSSLKNLEPRAMVNEMLIMAFKVIGAFLVINAGIGFFINYVVVPFMNFGSEFGLAMLASAQSASGLDIESMTVNSAYSFTGNVIPVDFLNNLLKYVAAVDYTVSTHLEIGHMLTCHSLNAGAYDWEIITIPNGWLWLSGAFIWFSGFMMTLAVTYYLVDISFKLGFSIIALPIVVGLWPFNITKGKLASCFSIILKSAGILIFLAMTVAAGLALVNAALDSGNEAVLQEGGAAVSKGSDRLMAAIENADVEYVSEHFAFWGFAWIIILFSYLFAIKLIGSTMTDYVDKFFPDQVFSSASPMHSKLTQATDMAKKTAMRPVKFAGKVLEYQGGKVVKAGARAVGGLIGSAFFHGKEKTNSLLDRFKSGKNKIDQISQGNFNDENKGQDQSKKQSAAESAKAMTGLDANKDKNAMKEQTNGNGGNTGGSSGAGQAMQEGGKAIKEGGRQIKEAADNIDQNLSNVDQTVRSGNQAANTVARAGTVASGGLLAPVTETTAAASNAATAATTTATTAGRVAAKAMKVTGEAIEKTGEGIEKAGKVVEKTEKTVKKTTDAVKKVSDTMKGNSEKDNDSKSKGDDALDRAMDQAFNPESKKE